MRKSMKFLVVIEIILMLSRQSIFAQDNLTNFQVTVNVSLSTGLVPFNEKYPPTGLIVDPLSLKASWCEPLITALDENFEDPAFPPAGWQTQSQQQGWQRTDNGSSGGWTIPAWDSFYAMANDDANGGSGNGCCDYLITPANYIEFWVYLDTNFVGVTTDTNWNFAPLMYGQSFTASVAALYTSGLSAKDYYNFSCEYLFPPDSLEGSAPDDAAILVWDPPLEFWPVPGYLVDIGELCRPATGQLPENLLGYNIYRNETFVDYIPHIPPGEYVPQFYVDEGISPGWYQYTVTAVYDLTPYGYPGETDESAEEGPVEITSCFCFELEFIETWALGNFDDNNWTIGSANWSVNGQTGEPAPAAEFSWDPIQANYSIALESFPISAAGMTEGKIWLDFDLKLDAVQPTGEELFYAQVWNWESEIWDSVAGYSNAEGSFSWTAEHIDISLQAMGKPFKVRFLATGVNSIDILSWFVDNIHIYRACGGPYDLTGQFSFQGNVINWEPPETSNIDEWIHWDDGVNGGNGIGTNEAVEFDCAVRWEPAQLALYDGASVTEIAFFPAEEQCVYNVRVWVGAGAANLVVDQTVANPTIGVWNYIMLSTPVPVDITQELWVGYHVNTQTGYPAGVDDGPAIDGYGNMMNFGGWQTLLQINPEFDFNWNIAAHLVTVAGVSMPLSKGVEVNSNAGQTLTLIPNAGSMEQVFLPVSGSRELAGYNIYRSENSEEFLLIDYTTETTYLDTDDDLIIGMYYCYMVSAVWTSESDLCESSFSNEDCIIVGIDSQDTNDAFNLYPNPANDLVIITITGQLKRVSVYSALGQLVVDEITRGNQYELKTSAYTIGVYMVRVETSAGVTTRTLTIQR